MNFRFYTNPVHKMIITIITAVLTTVIIYNYDWDISTKIMLVWNSAGIVFLILSWIAFFKNDLIQLRKYSGLFDKSHYLVFLILIFASTLSLVAILFLLKNNEEWKLPVPIITAIYFSGVVISWFIQHTIFTTHYAHIYYKNEKNVLPLDFPDTKEPNYIDFAYFAFTIGMTFQVSDVVIKSNQIRKVALFHGLISFVFNLLILSLSINAIMKI